MSGEKKIVQYLREANSMEEELTGVLTSQIAMTPRGPHRSALQSHLRETRNHAKRVQGRLSELDQGANPIELGIGLLESVVGQALALGRRPLDLLQRRGGEERLLNNAKDDCATEALEIATYTAIESLARSLGDAQTAKLAASIRNDEQSMLDLLMREIPTLTEAVASAQVRRKPSSRGRQTRAAKAGRSATRGKAARRASAAAKRPSGQARSTAKRPTRQPAPTTGQAPSTAKRSTRQPAPTTSAPGTERLGAEPWPSYEEERVDQIGSALDRVADGSGGDVDTNEREHEDRSGALDVTTRKLAST